MESNGAPPVEASATRGLGALRLNDVIDAGLRTALAEDTLTDFVLLKADESLLFSGVVSLPIVSPDGAATIADLIRPLLGRGGDGVGSMHNYGTDLATLAPGLLAELRAIFARLFAAVYAPPGSLADELVEHSAHAIGYGIGPTRERALRLHVDDSTYTASLCFSAAGCTGAALRFTGAQAVPGLPSLARVQRLGHRDELPAQPRAGWALLHRGCHPHRTTPIEAGERINAVLWYHVLGRPATVAQPDASVCKPVGPAAGDS